MEVNIQRAVKMFFSKSSFEMIYFEAVANAFDAGATEVNIEIKLDDIEQKQNLQLTIQDNGVGFDDNRFGKFRKLFDVEENTHKGLGRLVYLCYFNKVHVESVFGRNTKRVFDFTDDFAGESTEEKIDYTDNGSILTMSDFSGDRLHKNDYINISYLKQSLLECFYMKFFKAKQTDENLTINLKSIVEGNMATETIDASLIPEFSVKELSHKPNLFDTITLYYNIQDVELKDSKVFTAIAIDDRAYPINILSEENFPKNKKMIFLLVSQSFNGITDITRQSINVEDQQFKQMTNLFQEAITSVVLEQLPAIQESNNEKLNCLKNKYPHLDGYFNITDIGFASQSDILKKAQEKFFKDQREILGANSLSDEQYNKSMDLSARALAEYILFRQRVINKLKDFSPKNLEGDIHNVIAPKYSHFSENTFMDDLYKNNVWVLDDKFMSYRTILSEAEMKDVIKELTETEDIDDDRPDITLFFSGDPNDVNQKVDVVIVELKRLGLKPEQNSDVEIQLNTRARKLSAYYDNRIQRIWYYGIVEIDNPYLLHLKDADFAPVFSKGKIYYKAKKAYLDAESEKFVIAHTYIMDYKAVVEDADARNSTFLNILKQQFQKQSTN